MKNKDKFKTEEEQKEAHYQWCINKRRMCSQECNHCFDSWLDLDVDDTEGNDFCYENYMDWIYEEEGGDNNVQ